MDLRESTDDPRARARAGAPGETLAPGARVGSYSVVRLLGRGGMGEVYEAHDERLGRAVALKLIGGGRQSDADARARFWREARALAALRHPGVVTIYEIGDDAGQLFLAMELIDGRSLATVQHGPWPPRVALHTALALADALAGAHAVGIAHRDVKPSNVLIERGGAVRLIDFGLARRESELADQLTATGAVLGTPAWMSPEQVAGGVVGPPSDVFAAGTLLYWMLSGVQAFVRDSAQATALAVAGAVHKPLAQLRPGLPAQLLAAVERCLAVKPERRFPDGAALAEALRAALEVFGGPLAPAELAAWVAAGAHDGPAGRRGAARSPAARRLRWWPVAAGLAAAGGLAAALLLTEPLPRVGGRAAAAASLGDATALRSDAAAPSPPTAERHAAVSVVLAGLPPHPAVAVLGFTAPPSAASAAEVVADVLRTRLDEDPERIISLDRQLLDALLVDRSAADPTLPVELLVRPERALGHVDVAVRGSLEESPAGVVSVVAEVVDTGSGRILDRLSVEGSDAVTVGEELAGRLLPRLGGRVPAQPARLTSVPEAWVALDAAQRAAAAGDLDGVSAQLATALRLDPRFGLARAERLLLLRTTGQHDALVAEGEALLAEPAALPPRQAALTRALIDIVDGRTAAGLRELYAMRDRWPHDLSAASELMSVRAKSEAFHDYDEVERVARETLALAPRDEEAASRLIRVLAGRGRVAEAARVIDGLGIPRDDADYADIFAELDLFSDDFDASAREFRRVFAAEPGNVYAEHMAIASELLAGRCVDAAGSALDRIERVELRGKDSNLDWTYSLAVQALICAERWDQLTLLLDRWSAHSESGRGQAAFLRERITWLRLELDPPPDADAARARLSARWAAMLDAPHTPEAVSDALVGLMARVSRDAVELRRWRDEADRRALDVTTSAASRAAWRGLACVLRARLTWLAGAAAADVVGAYSACEIPPSRVNDEGDASAQVGVYSQRADAEAALGLREAAVADWTRVMEAGYGRLWATDLWVAARHRLESP